jgi:hypothetical protein
VQWLRNYATSRKVTGSRTDEVNYFFSIYLIIPVSLDSLVYWLLTEKSDRSTKIMFPGIRERPMYKAGNLTAICERIV